MLIITRSGEREPFDADKVAQMVVSLFSAQALERYSCGSNAHACCASAK